MRTAQTVIVGALVALVGKVGAEEHVLTKVSDFVSRSPRNEVGSAVNQAVKKAVPQAPAADTIVPADMYIYIVLAVLVLAVIALVVLILRKNGGASEEAVTYGDNSATEMYKEELPPPPAGPQLRVTYMVEGGAPIELALRYSEVKDRGNRLLIGRSRSCWLVVPDPYVSRKHIEMYAKGGNFWVRDCGSTSGTTLNRIPLDKDSMPLKDGDRLVLSAHANLRVHITPA